jgi:hypothetical protein
MDENLKGYLLDTNILIYRLKGDIPGQLSQMHFFGIAKYESYLEHTSKIG